MGSMGFEDDPFSNRSLLLELCATHNLCLANSFFEYPVKKLATHRNRGVPVMKDIRYPDFAQLDYLVIFQEQLDRVIDICTDRERHIQSHHFILSATLEVHLEKVEKRHRKKKVDYEKLDEV